jgi:hypothetical protein
MKNAFCPATALYGSAALPFVIPREVEGSAVTLLSRKGDGKVPALPFVIPSAA